MKKSLGINLLGVGIGRTEGGRNGGGFAEGEKMSENDEEKEDGCGEGYRWHLISALGGMESG